MQLMTERKLLADLLTRPDLTIAAVEVAVRWIPSTVNEHWETFRKYARQARTILELGSGMSTVAWLADGAEVTSVDVEPMPWAYDLADLVPGRLTFVQASSLDLEPRVVDLLYLDTLHVYEQLSAELFLHGPAAARWIICHDTESYGRPDSPLTKQYYPGDRGLLAAIDEFLAAYPEWRIVEQFTHQHGLTVLQRNA